MHPSHSQPTKQIELWLPTGLAARALGCSVDTLKRYAKRDEFLVDGKHWRQGPHPNSPWVWNVPACKEAIRWQGRLGERIPRPSRSPGLHSDAAIEVSDTRGSNTARSRDDGGHDTWQPTQPR